MKSRGYVYAFLTFIFVALISILALDRGLRPRMDQVRGEALARSSESASFRWHPLLFRLLSFGHVPSSVDWLLIRFLADDNITHVKAGEEPEVFRILDLATELDPAFFDLYASGGNFLAVVRNDRESALRLLSKGLRFMNEKLPEYPPSFVDRHWKQRWRIPFALGYLHLFEFQDMPAAIAAYEEMKSIETTPPPIRDRADRIRRPEAQFQIGMNTLFMMRGWHKNDPEMLREIERKEKMLVLAKDLYLWNQAFERFKREKRHASVQIAFDSFRSEARIPARDPLGGEIFLNSDGKIDSRTERVPVLGLDLASD